LAWAALDGGGEQGATGAALCNLAFVQHEVLDTISLLSLHYRSLVSEMERMAFVSGFIGIGIGSMVLHGLLDRFSW
jgi:hypothetical protein